jgi:hypothetical protein
MHLELVLVGLVALAAAAPIDKAGDKSMAGYEPYTKYETYYETYNPYPKEVEEEAEKVSRRTLSIHPKTLACERVTTDIQR